MPKVSVIIPGYNHADYLRQRIDSVLGQKFTDFELILLDDCSSDNSAEILQSYAENPRVSHVAINTTNSGSTFVQWTRGIELATGEYVWIAESDDYAHPELLMTLCERLDQDPTIGIAYCQSLIVDQAGRVMGSRRARTSAIPENPWAGNFVLDGRDMLQRFFIYENFIPNASAAVFRRAMADKELLIQLPEFRINGDWYMWSHFLLESRLAYIDREMNFWRFHPARSSPMNVRNFNNISEFYRLRGVLYEKLLLSPVVIERLNHELFRLFAAQIIDLNQTLEAPFVVNAYRTAESIDPRIKERFHTAFHSIPG